MSHIQVMFDPKTIALIGATEKEGAVGRTILNNLLRSKERKIFPVNPHMNKVMNMETCPTIASVPEHVDLAVVATPARSVPVVVEECGQAGVEGVVIISAGFNEIGEEVPTRIRQESANSMLFRLKQPILVPELQAEIRSGERPADG